MGRPIGNSETKYTTWWSGHLDFVSAGSHVRYWPKADMCTAAAHVRFTLKSAHLRFASVL